MTCISETPAKWKVLIIICVDGSPNGLTGYRSRFGAVLLLLYWVPVTFIVHAFWNDPPEIQRTQSIFFSKNLAISGGLLIAAVHEAGKYSIRRLFATYRVPNA